MNYPTWLMGTRLTSLARARHALRHSQIHLPSTLKQLWSRQTGHIAWPHSCELVKGWPHRDREQCWQRLRNIGWRKKNVEVFFIIIILLGCQTLDVSIASLKCLSSTQVEGCPSRNTNCQPTHNSNKSSDFSTWLHNGVTVGDITCLPAQKAGRVLSLSTVTIGGSQKYIQPNVTTMQWTLICAPWRLQFKLKF